MGVVSHSQVGEDLQIAYFLGTREQVTYIDIGCLWPVELSNTYFFYERGGHGLCIDANPAIAKEWGEQRPRDVFLNVGIGAAPGELKYHTFVNPVFNTFSRSRAKQVQRRAAGRKGRESAGSMRIAVITLDEAIRRTGFADRCEGELGFLSVDVEGLEAEVLEGFSFDSLRPKLVVSEYIRRRGERDSPEEAPISQRLSALGYELGGYTGHDLYFVDTKN